MKYIKYAIITCVVIFFYACSAWNTFAAEIIYDIYHHPEKLNIILQFKGNDNGVTNINIPSNIWGHNLNKQIKNIRLLDKNIRQKDSNTFLHNVGQVIKLSYDVVNIDTPRKDKFFYTHSEKEGFFFLHDFALIYPELNDRQNVILNPDNG